MCSSIQAAHNERNRIRDVSVRFTKISRSWICSPSVSRFVNLCAIYALIANDVRLSIRKNSSTDILFDTSIIICAVILFLDIILHLLSRSDYLLSLDFMEDFLSTLLLLADVSWIYDSVMYYPAHNSLSLALPWVVCIISSAKQLRLIRVVRTLEGWAIFTSICNTCSIGGGTNTATPSNNQYCDAHEDQDELQFLLDSELRSPQLAKLFSANNSSPRASFRTSYMGESTISLNSSRRVSSQKTGPQTNMEHTESKLGLELSRSNTRKVGLLIILCTAVSPFVIAHDESLPVYPLIVHNLNTSNQALRGLDYMFLANEIDSDATVLTYPRWIGYQGNDTAFVDLDAVSDFLKQRQIWPMEQESIEPMKCSNFFSVSLEQSSVIGLDQESGNSCPDSETRRLRELSFWTYGDFLVTVDERKNIQWIGIFGLIQTCATIILMLLLALLFNSDCNKLLLIPMNRLIGMMRAIQDDPLCANNLIDVEMNASRTYQDAKIKHYEVPWILRFFKPRSPILVKEKYRDYITREITQLEQTILKFGSLLIVGFGEAGATIISSIIRESPSSLIKRSEGYETEALFGYVRIHDFDTVTDVLQDGIVTLVNHVAEIVHGLASEYGGFIAKNTGSGFLVVWRYDSFQTRRRVADLALLAMVDIHVAIQKSPILADYSSHPHLMMRLPGYRVQVHTSLHTGLAIEGVIGSLDLKLETAYLGVDVAWTQKLASLAQKLYHIPIILSRKFVDILSPELNIMCRQIDEVTSHSEGQVSKGVYSFDVDMKSSAGYQFRREDNTVSDNHPHSSLRQYELRDSQRERRAKILDLNKNDVVRTYLMRADLIQLRKKYMSTNAMLFNEIFKKSLLNYICGEWEIARRSLRQCAMFWLTHYSREISVRVDGESSSPHLRLSMIAAMQSASDRDLLRIRHVQGTVDGPSLAMLEYITYTSLLDFPGYRKI